VCNNGMESDDNELSDDTSECYHTIGAVASLLSRQCDDGLFTASERLSFAAIEARSCFVCHSTRDHSRSTCSGGETVKGHSVQCVRVRVS
jgi:hypothetical protein